MTDAGSGRRAARAAGRRRRVGRRDAAMTCVKICGITRLEDARRGGRRSAPTRIGFVFWPSSPRFIDPHRARDDRRGAAAVRDAGRRVRQPAGRRTSTRRRRWCGLGAVQLHGDETPAFAAAVDASGASRRSSLGRVRRRSRGGRRACALLLDAHDPVARGGTGRTVDWAAAAAIAAQRGDRARRRPDARQRRRGDRARAAVRHRRVVGRRSARPASRITAQLRALVRGRCMT